MKVIHIDEVEGKENSSSLFTAPVTLQTAVNENDSEYNVVYVHFPKGVRNRFHKHNHDQILIVTEGVGYIATDEKQEEIKVGDVVVILAGEKHWHGATEDSAMTHISITAPKTSIEQIEQ